MRKKLLCGILVICFFVLIAATWLYSHGITVIDSSLPEHNEPAKALKNTSDKNFVHTYTVHAPHSDSVRAKEVHLRFGNIILQELRSQNVQPEILHFVDAWDEWHDAVIDPSVLRHSYNWTYLQRDGTELSYVGDADYFVRKGIDVSYHQGTIDWSKVKADGYDFAFVRIGYRGYGTAGGLNADKEFNKNLLNAQAAGLDVGVYFFSQAIDETEALEEAEFVLELLAGADLQLPVVYDPELIRDHDARTDDVTGEQFTQNTIVFCEAIKQAGYEPMIYSNMVWEGFLFDMKQLEKYPFWYADYEPIPQTPYHFLFWQYTDKGRVNGIDGTVDLDVQFIQNTE